MKTEIRNPKSERSPKAEFRNRSGALKRSIRISNFGFPSAFGLRPSDFRS
jgi:hypothetical protein